MPDAPDAPDAPEVAVRLATAADRPLVERLWQMFQHDMSEIRGLLPHPDGTFRNERLHSAFGDPDWAPYLFTLRGEDERPAGFAFVRSLRASPRVLNSFFVVRGARRARVGLRAVREVLARHPGVWEVASQEENLGAGRFWRRVATEIAGEAWREERRAVPGRPEVPPDVWLSFEVGVPPNG